MKTTFNLPDGLVDGARRAAREDGTTLTSLIEAGLRLALARRERRAPFVLRDASVEGRGLQAGFRGAGWERIRDASYESADTTAS